MTNLHNSVIQHQTFVLPRFKFFFQTFNKFHHNTNEDNENPFSLNLTEPDLKIKQKPDKVKLFHFSIHCLQSRKQEFHLLIYSSILNVLRSFPTLEIIKTISSSSCNCNKSNNVSCNINATLYSQTCSTNENK